MCVRQETRTMWLQIVIYLSKCNNIGANHPVLKQEYTDKSLVHFNFKTTFLHTHSHTIFMFYISKMSNILCMIYMSLNNSMMFTKGN